MWRRLVDRRRARERAHRHRVAQFLALAVLVHLAAYPLLTWLLPEPAPPGERPRKVRMVSLLPGSKTEARKRREVEREKKDKQRQEQKEPQDQPPPEPPDGQIVDVPPTADDRPPEDTEYLSEHNTRVERESRSRNQRQDYENATNELTRTGPKTPESAGTSQAEAKDGDVAEQDAAKNPKEQSQQKAAEAFELPELQQRDRLALELDPELGRFRNQSRSDAVNGTGKRLRLNPGTSGEPSDSAAAGSPQKKQVNLFPNVGVLAEISGAPANDDLHELEEGAGTFLNSRKFKYASFFNRLKQGVSREWKWYQEYRRRDPTGNVYGRQTRITVVNVTLDAKGKLTDIEIKRSSGLDFLDKEAVAAFQRAEPFPNPPSGLVRGGGVQFPFGFRIEFSGNGIRVPF